MLGSFFPCTELCVVILFWVVHWPSCPFCSGHLLNDVWAAGSPAASGQWGDGRHCWLAPTTREGVHGCGNAEPSATAGANFFLLVSCPLWMPQAFLSVFMGIECVNFTLFTELIIKPWKYFKIRLRWGYVYTWSCFVFPRSQSLHIGKSMYRISSFCHKHLPDIHVRRVCMEKCPRQ